MKSKKPISNDMKVGDLIKWKRIRGDMAAPLGYHVSWVVGTITKMSRWVNTAAGRDCILTVHTSNGRRIRKASVVESV